jgi:hypothetical protein
MSRSPTSRFISYEVFTGGVTPAAAACIRAYFNEAENNRLTPYGLSNFERNEREMKSVNLDEDQKVAF